MDAADYNAIQGRTFDELCHRFLEPLPADVLHRMERIVSAARIDDGSTVLDVGSGTGALIPLVRRRRPGRIVACDLSRGMLAELARRHPDVERHRMDVRDLALEAQSVDVAFMNAVFGNLVDKGGALANVARMLRPDGRLVVSHPEGRAFVERIAQEHPFPITPLPTREDLERLLERAGLMLVDWIDEPKLYLALGLRRAS